MVFLILLFLGSASDFYSSMREMLIKSFLFSSLIGIYLLNKLFHYKNLWVFVDNLQLSRNKLRIFSFLGYIIFTIVFSLIVTQ